MNVFILKSPFIRAQAKRAIDEAPEGCRVALSQPSKTRAQEDTYHQMLRDISRQMAIDDERLDEESWKRLAFDQFKTDVMADPTTDKDIIDYFKNNQVVVRPSLDKQRVIVLGDQTRRMTIKVASAFITWLEAWGVGHGVRYQMFVDGPEAA